MKNLMLKNNGVSALNCLIRFSMVVIDCGKFMEIFGGSFVVTLRFGFFAEEGEKKSQVEFSNIFRMEISAYMRGRKVCLKCDICMLSHTQWWWCVMVLQSMKLFGTKLVNHKVHSERFRKSFYTRVAGFCLDYIFLRELTLHFSHFLLI